MKQPSEMNEFIRKLRDDKIRINHNKNPIEMKKFISFLKIKTERSVNHLGADNGWTKLLGEDGLEINGGVICGVEYLESLKYKKNLQNKFNNFVNPFYLFGILTDEGKDFFVNYYLDDIKNIFIELDDEIKALGRKIAILDRKRNEFDTYLCSLGINIDDIN